MFSLLDDGSLTSTNVGNDHEFISEEYLRPFGEAQSKAMKASFFIVVRSLPNGKKCFHFFISRLNREFSLSLSLGVNFCK